MDKWEMTLMRNMIVMIVEWLDELDLETRRENSGSGSIDTENNTSRLCAAQCVIRDTRC